MWWHKETNPDYIESKKAMLKIMIPIIIPLGAFVFWVASRGPSAEESFYKRYSSGFMNGRVDSVYNDTENHNTRMIVLSDGTKCGLFRAWENQVKAGDSVSRSNGSLEIQVFKKDGKRIVLNYRDLGLFPSK